MELVIVLLLLGILSSVAVPRFFSLRGFQGDFYYDDVVSALRYAQRLAVASGCPVEFRFTGSDYRLTQRDACDTGAFTRSVMHPGSGEPAYDGSAPGGTSASATTNPMRFDALGRVVDSAGVPVDVTVVVGARSAAIAGESGFAHDPSI